MTGTQEQTVTPLVVETTVGIAAEEAFTRWTEDAFSWWPQSHSVGGERLADVVFEPRVGGRVYEVWDDGHTCPWALVLAWEPGRRMVLDWRPSPEPWGNEPRTEVEITFTDVDGGCAVRIEHRGWDRIDGGARNRRNYEAGWRLILDLFTTVTG